MLKHLWHCQCNSFYIWCLSSHQGAKGIGRSLPPWPIGPTDAQQNAKSCMQHTACEGLRGWNKHVIRSMLPSLRTKASGFAWQSCYSTVHIRIYMYWYHDGTRLCDNVTCTLSFIILWSTYFTHTYVWLYCVHVCVMLLVLSVAEICA